MYSLKIRLYSKKFNRIKIYTKRIADIFLGVFKFVKVNKF